MPRVLLTGVIAPHKNIYFDIMYDRLTKDQDIFTLSSHCHIHLLHFLAYNISAPCVVLENPTIENLIEEVKKGYDYVGINFTMVNISKLIQMCEAIREVAPKTKIVVGGHGTMCFPLIFSSEEEIHKYTDYVCYGEGVRFLRKLLGESADAPIRQIVGPKNGASLPWLDPYSRGENGFLVSGVGCPNRCEFCSTSAYYGGKFIELANADQLFEGMKQFWRMHPDARSMIIHDENLCKDKEKVSRLGKLIREDKEFGLRKMGYLSFSSVEDLSRYDVVEDLVLNGVGSIWIGVESLYSDLKKRQGRDPKELFDELHAHGITTTGSWIGGWDFHNKENIWEDLDYFNSCRPTFSQLVPLQCIPGTPLYGRLKSEGRLENVRRKDVCFGQNVNYKELHKNFTDAEITAIVENAPQRLYQEAGPSIMRAMRVHLNGYKFCKRSKHRVLREERAQYHKEACVDSYPLIKACEFFAPNDRVREEIAQMREEYLEEFGKPTAALEIMSDYVFLKASIAKITSRIGQHSPCQFFFRKYTYDKNKKGSKSGMPYRVEYPNRDERYELEKHRSENERRIVDKVVELIESHERSKESRKLLKHIRAELGNVETIGNLAKLVDSLGDRVGLAKGWLRTEVLKSVGAKTVYPDFFGNEVSIDEILKR